MGLSRRQFTKEFKLAAVRRLEQGVSIAEVARALEVNPNVLHRWRREFRQGPGNVFPGNGKQRWSEGRIAELERKVGQQTLEISAIWINRLAEGWSLNVHQLPRFTLGCPGERKIHGLNFINRAVDVATFSVACSHRIEAFARSRCHRTATSGFCRTFRAHPRVPAERKLKHLDRSELY
jgi:transposase-like protein